MLGIALGARRAGLVAGCLMGVLVCATSCGSSPPQTSPSPKGTILATEFTGAPAHGHTWIGVSELAVYHSVPGNHCHSVWTLKMALDVDTAGKATGTANAVNGGIHCAKGFVGSEMSSLAFKVTGLMDDAGFTLSLRDPKVTGSSSGFMGGFEVSFLPISNPPALRIPLIDHAHAKGTVDISHSGGFERNATGRVSGTLNLTCQNC